MRPSSGSPRTSRSGWRTGSGTWATGTSPAGATTGCRCRSTPERAVEGFEQLQELRRPWIDRVPIRCEQCGEQVERIAEVGDVWLDAGIVPFSTLGWRNPTWIEGGYGRGAAAG